jgi:preprotein translocase subunit SecF
MTGRQIDLLSITAFLTIAGYSINDTIVIYDRVRENSRLFPKLKLYELINLSVNQKTLKNGNKNFQLPNITKNFFFK